MSKVKSNKTESSAPTASLGSTDALAMAKETAFDQQKMDDKTREQQKIKRYFELQRRKNMAEAIVLAVLRNPRAHEWCYGSPLEAQRCGEHASVAEFLAHTSYRLADKLHAEFEKLTEARLIALAAEDSEAEKTEPLPSAIELKLAADEAALPDMWPGPGEEPNLTH